MEVKLLVNPSDYKYLFPYVIVSQTYKCLNRRINCTIQGARQDTSTVPLPIEKLD